MGCLSAVLMALSAIPTQSAMADITVCASGCAFSRIQDAILVAADNEAIRIRPGIYPETLVIANQRVRLIGAGANLTIIDAASVDSNSRVVDIGCVTEKRVVLDGLTVTGGHPVRGVGGGGIQNSGCRVAISNSLITGNFARGAAGISNGGRMTVSNTVVSNNGAFDLGGGGIDNSGTLDLTQSQIISNHASSGGGGIDNGGTLTGRNVTVANNTARIGGGININTLSSGALVAFSVLNNEATQKGGGFYNVGALKLKDSLVMANESGTATATPGFADGGGIYNGDVASLQLVGTLVTRNTSNLAIGSGGGLFNDSGALTLGAGTAIVSNQPDDCVGCP
jgi:hypothetical protein